MEVPCWQCGGPRGKHSRGVGLCRQCYHSERARNGTARRLRIFRVHEMGSSWASIAEVEGVTVDRVRKLGRQGAAIAIAEMCNAAA